MTVQPVSDFRSNEPDQIVYAAKKLGRSELKKKIFKAVYFGKKKVKTIQEIAESTGLTRKQVLDKGKQLVTARLIHQTKHKNDTAYSKDDSYQGPWKQILNLAGNNAKINKIPTKTNPKIKIKSEKITIKVPASFRAKAKLIVIDDVDSFNKVKKVKDITGISPKIAENKFKNGILKILNEKSSQKDWGGEKNDIYTTKLKMRGKRFCAAFALKGPGQRIKKLTPKHMGKNGDQIQRLTGSSAQVFIVQYWGEIDQSVVDLMLQLAIAKSVTEGREIYYGTINGDDSARLIKAYKNFFK